MSKGTNPFDPLPGLRFMAKTENWEIALLASSAVELIASLTARLAAAEADRDIADKQLTVICEGVNRRCGADNKQLPIVSLDRMLAKHTRDRVNLIAWVLRNMDMFGCFSGDCPHNLNSECIESIVQQYEEDEAARGGRDE